MSDNISLKWYPGHMSKARGQIRESLPLIDCVMEVADARVPVSSRNPDLSAICRNKPVILALCKNDLADTSTTSLWLDHFKRRGISAIAVDCKSGNGINWIIPGVRKLIQDKIEANAARGMKKKVRIMAAGMPNTGKSTLINRLAGGKRTKTGDRPGVTRGKQWIDIGGGMELLDTPGVLSPKVADQETVEKLAFCGAVKDEVFDIEELAENLLNTIKAYYPEALEKRYGISCEDGGNENLSLLSLIGRKRGMLVRGGGVDTVRASSMVLDEFRRGKIGRISLERP